MQPIKRAGALNSPTSPSTEETNRASRPSRIVLVGGSTGTNVAASLLRAARQGNAEATLVDIARSVAGPKLLRTAAWRLFDHRPLRLSGFSRTVSDACLRAPADLLIATGLAAIREKELREIGKAGVRRVVLLTDDPWNRTQSSRWFFRALRHYDVVFSMRQANLQQLADHGCRAVHYLPFGYDPDLAHPPTAADLSKIDRPAEVLFVGGADRDRIPLMELLIRRRIPLTIYGAEWPKHGALSRCVAGYADPAMLRAATSLAKVNLILVRRANRDGHVMRSLEAGAIGGCLLVEHTAEHEALFGPDRDAVCYFRSDEELADQCETLLGDSELRSRLRTRVFERIRSGGHSYADRLKEILRVAGA